MWNLQVQSVILLGQNGQMLHYAALEIQPGKIRNMLKESSVSMAVEGVSAQSIWYNVPADTPLPSHIILVDTPG